MFQVLLTTGVTVVALKGILPLLLGLGTPTKEGVKWLVQTTKPLVKLIFTKVPADQRDSVQSSAVEMYAILAGAIILPVAAFFTGPMLGIVVAFDPVPLGAAAVVGGAAGAWAVGDYNAWKSVLGLAGQILNGIAGSATPPPAK